MSGVWPKVIRDPVHDFIPFEDTACDRLLLDLINSREFQRLRRIKQLGVSELVFPGANHSRFAHSIGVMQTARMFLERIGRLVGDELTDDHRMIVLAAALIHDVGHGPFSHAFEAITGENHEARTLQIIRDDSTDIHQRLRAVDSEFPERVAMFFDEEIGEDDWPETSIPAYLTQVVSSQLDADRFDYLLRDSYATGTIYGQFDHRWLINQLHLRTGEGGTSRRTIRGGRLYLSNKALFAAEAYLFARHHMYRAIYYHKTTRAAEVMLRLVFRRYKESIAEATSEAEARTSSRRSLEVWSRPSRAR